MKNNFSVKIVNFSGPFDLLIQLLNEKKMDITEISLGEITDEFIKYIDKLFHRGEIPLEEISSFLVVSSKLLKFKVFSLLPKTKSIDNDKYLFDENDVFFSNLVLYKAFQDTSLIFKKIIDIKNEDFRININFPVTTKFKNTEIIVSDLVEAYQRILSEKDESIEIEHIHVNKFILFERTKKIATNIKHYSKINMSKEINNQKDILEKIMSFLGILELEKQNFIFTSQNEPLADIIAYWNNDSLIEDLKEF